MAHVRWVITGVNRGNKIVKNPGESEKIQAMSVTNIIYNKNDEKQPKSISIGE